MELKTITEKDLEFVRGLRNFYRQWFFNNEIVTPEAQLDWYKNHQTNYLGFYIIWDNDRIGTLSVRDCQFNPDWPIDNPDGKLIEIGNLMIDPNLARQGVMAIAVTQLMEKSYNYIAFVKDNNYKSANLFRKLGFKETSYGNTIIFTKGKTF